MASLADGEIDAASDGGTVVVAPGTYVENIDFKGKAIEVRSAAGAHATIVDGGGNGCRRRLQGGRAGSDGTGGGALIVNNFVLENTADSAGGGVQVEDSSPPYLLNNTIVDNEAPSGAGVNIEAEACG